MDRPRIPAETARQVLIEAGHRCAVCGTPTPLEQAHIIPWSKSRDHSAANLICLCANCHSRTDKEKWGQRTLRQYKLCPWVLRQQRPPERKADTPFATEGPGQLVRSHNALGGFDAPLPDVLSPPSGTAFFVERQAYLEEIEAALSGPSIVLLWGMAGVGKTELAIRYAQRVKARGQRTIFVPGFPSVIPCALFLLRALGRTQCRPDPSVAVLYHTVQSLWGTEGGLVLFDNVRQWQIIQKLAPQGGNWSVIVTARDRAGLAHVTLRPVSVVHVRPFAEEETTELFQRRLGDRVQNEDAASKAIGELVGNLPIAVDVAAALAVAEDLPLAAIATRIADERTRLRHLTEDPIWRETRSASGEDELGEETRNVRAALHMSIAGLPDEAVGLLLALASFDQETGGSEALVSAVAKVEPTDGATFLSQLHARSIVERTSREPYRYKLHVLMWILARHLCEERGLIKNTDFGHAAVMLLTVVQLHDMTPEGNADYAHHFFLAESANMRLAAQRLRRGVELPHGSPAGPFSMFGRFVAYASGFTQFAWAPDEHQELLEAGIADSVAQSDKFSEGGCRMMCAGCLLHGGEGDRAIFEAERALALAEESGNEVGAATAGRILGQAQLSRGMYEEAIATLSAAAEICNRIDSRMGQGICSVEMARACYLKGDEESAERLIREARDHFSTLNDTLELANCDQLQAMMAMGRGSRKDATDWLDASKSKYARFGAPGAQARVLLHLADLSGGKKTCDVVHDLTRAVELATKYGRRKDAVKALLKLAEALERERDLEGAEKRCREALRLLSAEPTVDIEESPAQLRQTPATQGKHDEPVRRTAEELPTANAKETLSSLGDAHFLLGLIALDRDDPHGAIAQFDSALERHGRTGNRVMQIKDLCNQASQLQVLGLNEGAAAALFLAREEERTLGERERDAVRELRIDENLSAFVLGIAGADDAREFALDLRKYADDIRRRDIGRAMRKSVPQNSERPRRQAGQDRAEPEA